MIKSQIDLPSIALYIKFVSVDAYFSDLAFNFYLLSEVDLRACSSVTLLGYWIESGSYCFEFKDLKLFG